jgi:hypothetical protein
MNKYVLVLLAGLVASLCSFAQDNPGTIIAVGDVHGDHQQFVKVLETTGLIDSKQRWAGGATHLVQLGDLPDRGPDTRKTMDLLMKLEASATEDGGSVTVLVGNHDMMNVMDDLRYVHPGEYKAFKSRNSKTLRSNYYKQVVAYLTETLPKDERPSFDRKWRKDWEAKHPLGYVEHRMAWAPTGTYGEWVMERPAVAIVGDSLFVHGGISPEYADMSVDEMNAAVHEAMAAGYANADDSILYDADGPLWFRGWSQGEETAENDAALASVLDAFGVERMVVAHTPVLPVVFPRYDNKVFMVDVGLADHYGHGFSALKIEGEQLSAMVGGQWFELPSAANTLTLADYLEQVRDVSANPGRVERYLAALEASEPESAQAAPQGQ